MTFEMFKSKFPQIEPINIKLKKNIAYIIFKGFLLDLQGTIK